MKLTVVVLAAVGVVACASGNSMQAEALAAGECWVRGDAATIGGRASALDSTSVALESGTVKICYGRPKMNDREIFGGLVPLDRPWRLGANEATTIFMPVAGSVAGVAVEPGWYSLYVVPGTQQWTVVVNSAAQRWGVPINDAVRANDVGTGTVAVEATPTAEETLSLRLEARADNRADVVVHWENTRVRIPVVLGAE